MFLFKSCCCAFSLRTGTLMIGWFSLFFRVCLLIGLSVMLVMERIHLAEVRGAQKDARGPNPNEEIYFSTCNLYPEEKEGYLTTVFNRSDFPRKNETEYDEGYLAYAIRLINFDTISYHANLLLGPSNETETYIDQSNSRSKRDIRIEEPDIRIVEPDMLEEIFRFEVLLGRVVLSTISICTAILLIVGAVKGCVRLLLPWITSEILIILLNVIMIISNITGSYNGKREIIIGQTFVIGLYIFMLLVVMSHCKELERTDRKNRLIEEDEKKCVQVV